jgi:hypothetical protein
VRLATVLGVLALVTAGCGSHHERHAAPQKPKLIYVTKLVGRPGCQLSPFPTRAEMRRFIRRCSRP